MEKLKIMIKIINSVIVKASFIELLINLYLAYNTYENSQTFL